MKILAAYCTVILIWSTTPLAIKWSGEGPGFLLGVTARMVIGLLCVLLLLLAKRQRLPWQRRALACYLAVGVHLYGSMLAVYWGAQWIPSGWVAVIFGLTPLLTAILSRLWLRGYRSSSQQWLAYGGGLAGLAILFGSAPDHGPNALCGMLGVLLSALLQALSAVWIKRLEAGIAPLCQLGGGLLLAVPAYLATWAWFDGIWPPPLLPVPALASIVYLGVVATTIGFPLYYYVLNHLAATRVSLITLVTPVSALYLGNWINGEPLTARIAGGTACILLSLLVHEFARRAD